MEGLRLYSKVNDNFEVRSYRGSYSVVFSNDIPFEILKFLQDGDLVLIDKKVRELYEDYLTPVLNQVKYIEIEATEEQKSYKQLESMIGKIISIGVKKNNRLIAIGGGITQDITGFISSILYRGIDWMFVPTTLLAQCDSCIGSKTSINYGMLKNQLGSFYPPKKIYIDTRFLSTLSDEDMHSGMGEMFHYFLVSGEEDYRLITNKYDESLTNQDTLRFLIKRSLEIKKKYIEIDEYDQNERRVFNYGHSFGHVIETLSNYKISHGVAVCFGMDIANQISEMLGYISTDLRVDINKLLSKNWGRTTLKGINPQNFKEILCKDKKNIGNKIRVILTKGLGKMFQTELVWDKNVEALIMNFFEKHSH